MTMRDFLNSAENPVPMLPGETPSEYGLRLLATGRAREWEAAKAAYVIREYRNKLIARFGAERTDVHLRRVGIL